MNMRRLNPRMKQVVVLAIMSPCFAAVLNDRLGWGQLGSYGTWAASICFLMGVLVYPFFRSTDDEWRRSCLASIQCR